MYQKSALLSGDLIKCGICDYTSAKLTLHVKKEHNISPEEYREKYGSLVCDNSIKRYSAVAKENGSWIKRANESGIDLSDFRAKVSESISKSIMANPKERERRAELLGNLNKTEAFRRKASETAKKTSARIDIQKSRAARLKRWRELNPDTFLKKCTLVMHSRWQSLPEKKLFEFFKSIDEDFERNKQIKSKKYFLINKTNTKQIDILNKSKKIIVEFDGRQHFAPIFGEEVLEKIRQKDIELEKFCIDNDFILIRVSQSCFTYRSINDFSESIKDNICKIINNNIPGNYFIGAEYKCQK
jgi:very-short-patch-repair endonuclease